MCVVRQPLIAVLQSTASQTVCHGSIESLCHLHCKAGISCDYQQTRANAYLPVEHYEITHQFVEYREISRCKRCFNLLTSKNVILHNCD